MILFLLSPQQPLILLYHLPCGPGRFRCHMIDNDIDHQEHAPLMERIGECEEIVLVPEPRVEEGRILNPITVVRRAISRHRIDIPCNTAHSTPALASALPSHPLLSRPTDPGTHDQSARSRPHQTPSPGYNPTDRRSSAKSPHTRSASQADRGPIRPPGSLRSGPVRSGKEGRNGPSRVCFRCMSIGDDRIRDQAETRKKKNEAKNMVSPSPCRSSPTLQKRGQD